MRTSAFIKTTSSRSLTLWFYVAKHVVVAPKCQTFSIHYEYSVYDSRNQWNISDFGLSDAKYSAIRPFLFYGCWMRLNGIFEHVFFLAFNKRCHFPSSCHFFAATRKRRDFVHFWNVSHKWYYKNFCWMCSIASAFMNIEFPSSENQNCFRFFFRWRQVLRYILSKCFCNSNCHLKAYSRINFDRSTVFQYWRPFSDIFTEHTPYRSHTLSKLPGLSSFGKRTIKNVYALMFVCWVQCICIYIYPKCCLEANVKLFNFIEKKKLLLNESERESFALTASIQELCMCCAWFWYTRIIPNKISGHWINSL